VRSPWDVYVSYYFFQRELLSEARARLAAMSSSELEAWSAAGNDPLNGVDVLFEEISAGGTLDFASTTRRILDLSVDDRLLQPVLDKMPAALDRRGRCTPVQATGFRGMNVRAEDLASIQGTGEGLYSFLFRHLYGDGQGVDFLRAETLREDLLGYLSKKRVDITPEMEQFVRGSARVNASHHGPCSSYYDRELRELVQERDFGLVQRFGYEGSVQ
jgi:hypothetical protein